jgi:hypothetical protein
MIFSSKFPLNMRKWHPRRRTHHLCLNIASNLDFSSVANPVRQRFAASTIRTTTVVLVRPTQFKQIALPSSKNKRVEDCILSFSLFNFSWLSLISRQARNTICLRATSAQSAPRIPTWLVPARILPGPNTILSEISSNSSRALFENANLVALRFQISMAEMELGDIQGVTYSTKIAISHIAQEHFWARRSRHMIPRQSSIMDGLNLHSSEELLQPSAFT